MSAPRSTQRRGISPAIVVLLLALLIALYLYQSGRLQRMVADAAAPYSAGRALGGSPAIQVLFTTPALVYPDTPSGRPAAPLLAAVVADVDAARRSVDLATFDFDLPAVADALLRARARGADVRVVVDSENLDTPEVSEQTGRLQRAGIVVRFDRREPFMHDKFVIVDGAVVWTGSWNLTENDTWRNNNQMLRFASRQIAADYAHEFEQLFGGRFGTAKISGTPFPLVRLGTARAAIYFSPEDGVAKHVLERLAAARRSIHFMTFSYTEDTISDAMIAKRRAGLVVRGVFESNNAGGSGADFGRLKAGGVDVLEDGNCYILHHKVIIIDERTVITGSYNFTSSAEKDNDENLVIVDDPNLARAYLDEFERVYAQAQAPTRCR
jgi:phosphatidylserine/phosphatidylglycerophosphate/cardiolipin synthase-like enzyme